MCGINGILIESGADTDITTLDHQICVMNDAVAHRGPDGQGRFVAPGVALGHRRLAIIDLSDAGHQPMLSADGRLVLVFNGEIYNYVELMRELSAMGCVFRSRSDTEVVLHAYEVWGERCVERFNGMWALALWDTARRRLFVSRDRLGVKPFCYQRANGRFHFSSEAAGILAVGGPARANLGKLHDYLAYGYRLNDGETLFEGIHELPPGHNGVLEGGRFTTTRYWTLPEGAPAEPAPDATERYAELLRDAVRLRMRSDVPVALLQSGGLDSSVICSIVNDDLAAGRLDAASITAYTAVHPGHAYDESAAVRALMATCPRVQSVALQPDSATLSERLPLFVQRMQEPMASATSYAHWCLMQAIHGQGIKVVLNGQGADEALAGYGRYVAGYRLLDLALTQPAKAWDEARAMHGLMGLPWPLLLQQMAKAAMGRRAASNWRATWSEGGARVLDPTLRAWRRRTVPEVGSVLGSGNLDRHLRSQLLQFGFNQILHYEDQSSMSESVEIRSPFIDYRLMEMAFSLPVGTRFSGGVTKRILREGWRTRLPEAIVDNHRKLGFATPFEQWARQPAFRRFIDDLVASRSFQERRIWDAGRLGKRLRDPATLASSFPTWRFINTELWLRAWNISNA